MKSVSGLPDLNAQFSAEEQLSRAVKATCAVYESEADRVRFLLAGEDAKALV